MLENENLGERDTDMSFSICRGCGSVGSGSARGAPRSLGTMRALGHVPKTGGVSKSYDGVSTYQVFLESKLISRHP